MPTHARLARMLAAAALAAATLGVPATTASAQPRDYCSDTRNKERADRNGGITQDISTTTQDAHGNVIDQVDWGTLDYGEPLPLGEGYEETFGRNAPC
jgi:hypothetical protein